MMTADGPSSSIRNVWAPEADLRFLKQFVPELKRQLWLNQEPAGCYGPACSAFIATSHLPGLEKHTCRQYRLTKHQ
jgi:uncharacterized protein with von Willebrand factor type A (vWA) domain